ncbi:tetratricopeptide repeat protein [Micromonospora sp. DT228]|uniref:tetratricopeptide repeat protein n=1 Tax=Micromonospora sp. DT228 TaxID=3393443 RepID=UPI003CF3321E
MGGLHYEPNGDEAFDRLRRQAESLSRNLGVDIGRTRTFATASPDDVAMSGGLVTVDDPAVLAEQMRAVRARESDLKVQRLLERAERAAGQDDYDSALDLVDEALELTRSSLSAWLLRGRCQIARGEFAEAAKTISVARQQAKDPQGIRLAAALAAECDRAELSAFAAELNQLIDRGLLDKAEQRIRDRLRDRPDHPILQQNLCVVLLLAGKLGEARATAEAGRFEKLLRVIAQRESEPQIEAARHALRRGNTRAALDLLDACAGAIGDSEHFLAIRSYAQERAAARGFRLIGRARRRADAEPIDDDTLQWLIEWLVQDELTVGMEALENEDYQGAQPYFEAAEAIDDRCNLVAFLHAVALFRSLFDQFEGQRTPTLDEAHDVLVEAERLAAQATGDPKVGAPSRDLAGTIRASLDTVREVRKQVARAEAVAACVATFNALVQRYERSPIRTIEQLNSARYSFRALARDVDRLSREGSSEAREVTALHELTQAIARIQQQLNRH